MKVTAPKFLHRDFLEKLGLYQVILRAYFLLCIKELILAVFTGPNEILGIKPGLDTHRASALPTVLLLQPFDEEFLLLRQPGPLHFRLPGMGV